MNFLNIIKNTVIIKWVIFKKKNSLDKFKYEKIQSTFNFFAKIISDKFQNEVDDVYSRPSVRSWSLDWPKSQACKTLLLSLPNSSNSNVQLSPVRRGAAQQDHHLAILLHRWIQIITQNLKSQCSFFKRIVFQSLFFFFFFNTAGVFRPAEYQRRCNWGGGEGIE